MNTCCKARCPKGQPRYQLPDDSRPPMPEGTLAARTQYLLQRCLEELLRARIRRVDARALLSVFPHTWEDGKPICLVYHTDADGDFGSFRMVVQGDGQPSLQCMRCQAVVGGVGGAEQHVFSGKPTNNAKKYLYVYSVQLSLSGLTDRINEGLLQAQDLVWRTQQQAAMQQAVLQQVGLLPAAADSDPEQEEPQQDRSMPGRPQQPAGSNTASLAEAGLQPVAWRASGPVTLVGTTQDVAAAQLLLEMSGAPELGQEAASTQGGADPLVEPLGQHTEQPGQQQQSQQQQAPVRTTIDAVLPITHNGSTTAATPQRSQQPQQQRANPAGQPSSKPVFTQQAAERSAAALVAAAQTVHLTKVDTLAAAAAATATADALPGALSDAAAGAGVGTADPAALRPKQPLVRVVGPGAGKRLTLQAAAAAPPAVASAGGVQQAPTTAGSAPQQQQQQQQPAVTSQQHPPAARQPVSAAPAVTMPALSIPGLPSSIAPVSLVSPNVLVGGKRPAEPALSTCSSNTMGPMLGASAQQTQPAAAAAAPTAAAVSSGAPPATAAGDGAAAKRRRVQGAADAVDLNDCKASLVKAEAPADALSGPDDVAVQHLGDGSSRYVPGGKAAPATPAAAAASELNHQQLLERSCNLAELEDGMEAFLLISDLLESPEPAQQQVAAWLLDMLSAGDPSQLQQWDLQGLSTAPQLGQQQQQEEGDGEPQQQQQLSCLELLKDVLLWQARQASIGQHVDDLDVLDCLTGRCQLLLFHWHGSSAVSAVQDQARSLLMAVRGIVYQVLPGHEEARPARCAMLHCAASAVFQANPLGPWSPTGETPADAAANVVPDCLRKMTAAVLLLSKHGATHVLSCERTWSALQATFVGNPQAASGALEQLVECLLPGDSTQEYMHALLDVLLNWQQLMQWRERQQPLGVAGSTSTETRRLADEQRMAALECMTQVVAQAKALAVSSRAMALNSSSSSGQQHQELVQCVLARVQLARAVAAVLGLSDEALAQDKREMVASGTQTAVELAARVVGQERPQVLLRLARLARASCEQLVARQQPTHQSACSG